MDGSMTQQTQSQSRGLCPHLAAASLWMTKNSRTVRRGGKPRIRYARAFGPAVDDLLAL
jgi:hypothetical protein